MGIGFILVRSVLTWEGAEAKTQATYLMEIKGSKLGSNVIYIVLVQNRCYLSNGSVKCVKLLVSLSLHKSLHPGSLLLTLG